MLTETKINRNVKKNLMVMTTAFFSVTTGWRQRAHRKKTSAPEVLQGVGCARFVPARVRGSRPGWRIRPREAVAFFHRSVPGRLSLDRYRKCLHFGQEVGPRRSWEL